MPATIADHIEPHHGDWTAFCTGELQSLCDPRHKSTKQQIERQGYCDDVGIDGYPIDHPFNRARSGCDPRGRRGVRAVSDLKRVPRGSGKV